MEKDGKRFLEEVNLKLALFDMEKEEGKRALPLFDVHHSKDSKIRRSLWRNDEKKRLQLICHTEYKGKEYKLTLFLGEYSNAEKEIK